MTKLGSVLKSRDIILLTKASIVKAMVYTVERKKKEEESHSVVSDSLRPHGLQPTRFFCPWDFPGKSTGVRLQSRDIILQTKIHIVKTMVFPVVMYRCESQTITKAEQQRIDTLKLWCQRRILRVNKSNQSLLKEIKPDYSLEGLMLKLKLQYFGHLMQRADSLEKTLMLEKIEG